MSTEPTAARVARLETSHWYDRHTGEPCHEQPKAKGGGTTPTTIKHARKLGLLPSVTNIQDAAGIPRGLANWKTEQACLAVLTAPRVAGENEDAFVRRVLHDREEQEQVSDAAKQLGTDCHLYLASLILGEQPTADERVRTICAQGYNWFLVQGLAGAKVALCERVVVNLEAGYAGTVDLVLAYPDRYLVVDWKTKGEIKRNKARQAYASQEHEEQVSAYRKAALCVLDTNKAVYGCNVYLSTSQPGDWAVVEYSNDALVDAYANGFLPYAAIWRRRKGYDPRNWQAEADIDTQLVRAGL